MNSPSTQQESSKPVVSWRSAVIGWFDQGEPQVIRGPFSRWPRTTDAGLALLVLAGSLITVTLSALGDNEDYRLDDITELDGGAIALLVAAAAALFWRRRHSVPVTAAVLVVMAVWAAAGYGDGNDLALIAAMYAIGRYTTDPRHSLAMLATAVAISVLGTVVDTNQRVDVAPAVALPAVAWYVGRRIRNRGDYMTLLRERSERLEADQQAKARRAVADERSRIARELHDVVAHQVSMMTVQAGAAKTIACDDIGSAVAAMGDVEQAGRQALGELRQLLGVLRADSGDGEHLGPQPGIANLHDLTNHLTSTGAQVTLAVAAPEDLPASLDLSAYRIAQESITNIIKHGGPHPTVDVAVSCDQNFLVIEITNTTDNAIPPLPTSGFGIAGMKERASLLGGTLSAERVPPGRFRVLARLPLEPERT